MMEDETHHDELARLRKAQIEALRKELYGGLSAAEKAEYDRIRERIREIEKSAS